jgi:hypothetical protein
MPAYVSSPELTFGFMFALEEPDKIAERIKAMIDRKVVSIFKLANVTDGSGPPDRYVVNWACIPQVSITTAAPDAAELQASRTMLVNAFLGESGEVRLYSVDGPVPG